VINDPALLTIAIEAGQTLANSGGLLYANVTKMYGAWRRNAERDNRLLDCKSDLLPALLSMQLVVKNVAGTENVGARPQWLSPIEPMNHASYWACRCIVPKKLSCVAQGDVILADSLSTPWA